METALLFFAFAMLVILLVAVSVIMLARLIKNGRICARARLKLPGASWDYEIDARSEK